MSGRRLNEQLRLDLLFDLVRVVHAIEAVAMLHWRDFFPLGALVAERTIVACDALAAVSLQSHAVLTPARALGLDPLAELEGVQLELVGAALAWADVAKREGAKAQAEGASDDWTVAARFAELKNVCMAFAQNRLDPDP